jgi:hypothetical protein
MKKRAALATVCALALAVGWTTPSFASGIRVQAMGGINLGVMDESTQINLFNALNPAGLGMLEKKTGLTRPSIILPWPLKRIRIITLR